MYNHKRCQAVLLRTNNNHSNSKLIVALTRPVWHILTSSTLRSHVSGVRPQGSLNSKLKSNFTLNSNFRASEYRAKLA